jgi:hypothetical protein
MIWHELRLKPIAFWIALCAASGACEGHESVWNESARLTVTRGAAVSPWSDAEILEREDASADASEPDAALSDGGPDASAAASDAALDDPFEGIDARCVFRVTALPLGGLYAPRNIGAIWIAHSDGTWVKTLALWAGVRIRYLTAYRQANPTGNKVDAVTSATKSMFGDHVAGWDLGDANGGEIADGDYQVVVEVTDRDATGETLTVPFMKIQPPFQITAPNTDSFSGVELRCR